MNLYTVYNSLAATDCKHLYVVSNHISQTVRLISKWSPNLQARLVVKSFLVEATSCAVHGLNMANAG